MCLDNLTVYACVCMDDHVDVLVVCMPIEPIKPIEISIGLGSKIQDPRLLRGLPWESWILDLGPD